MEVIFMMQKIAITLDEKLLGKVDRMVKGHVFLNRSKAIQAAVTEKLARLEKTHLAQECLKLNLQDEQELAEEGMTTEITQWPQY